MLAIAEKHGVDVIIGECGIFESGIRMTFGMPQATGETFLREEVELFEQMGLAWTCELQGRYAPLVPAPYLVGVEFEKMAGMPYYANQSMEAFFKEIIP